MLRLAQVVGIVLAAAATVASCSKPPSEAVDGGGVSEDAGADAGLDAGPDASADAGWNYGMDCPASGPSSLPAASPRILILGPSSPDTLGIASHLQGMLAADVTFVAPFVRGLTTEASADAGSLESGVSLMNFYYLSEGRDARLAPLAEPWTYVVLLEQFSFAKAYPEFYFEGVRVLGCRARASGAKPVVLMTWSPGADAAARGEVTYRVANGTNSIVAPAGYAWEAASAPVWGRDDGYLAAATLYATLTGRNAGDTSYRPAGIDAAPLAQVAFHTVKAEATKVHYAGAYRGIVQLSTVPAPKDFWFMASGSSSEQIWLDRMNEILPRAGLTPHGMLLGYTNPQKAFDNASLDLAAPLFQQHPYRVLLARTFYVNSADIADAGAPPDLQGQLWDRHFDSDPSDGAVFVNEMEGRLASVYGEARVLGLTQVPYHLMFAKLKTARPSVQLLSDGVHATYPAGYGLATMSLVSATGLRASTTGLDADTELAAQLADETIRQLSALSVTKAFVPDDPATRPGP
jgi:hypothetical protein